MISPETTSLSPEWVMVGLTILGIIGAFSAWLFSHFDTKENSRALAGQVLSVREDLVTNSKDLKLHVESVKDDLIRSTEKIDENFNLMRTEIKELKEEQTIINKSLIFYQSRMDENQKTLRYVESLFKDALETRNKIDLKAALDTARVEAI